MKNPATYSFWYIVPLVLFITAPQLTYRLPSAWQLQYIDEELLAAAAASAAGGDYDYTIMIVRGASYVLALALFVKGLPLSIKVASRNASYVLLACLALVSASWSSYPGKVLINAGHLFGMLLVAISTARYFTSKPANLLIWISALYSPSLIVSLIVCLAIPGSSIGWDGRWIGVLSNSNALGALATIQIWLATAILYSSNVPRTKLFGWFIFGFAAVVLFGTGSRTSLITSLAMAGAIVCLMYIRTKSGGVNPMRLVLLGIVGTAVLALILLARPELLSYAGLLNALGRTTTLTGRTEMWELAYTLIAQRPWFGWSFDSNLSLLREMRAFITASGQFHNGYIDLLARGGWVAVILASGFIFQIVANSVRAQHVNYALGCAYIAFVAGVLLHEVTEASLARDTSPFWFMLIVISVQLVWIGVTSGIRDHSSPVTARANEEDLQTNSSGSHTRPRNTRSQNARI